LENGSGVAMSLNKTNIEWCINPDGTPGFTFNPITGCNGPDDSGACYYCYAKSLIETRFKGKPGYDMNNPFTPTFHQKRLLAPMNKKKPSGIFVCYDPETDILTELGWKNISEVGYGDRIATLNRETGFLEYQYPSGVIKQEYNGKMYNLKTKVLDICVTEDHRMFVALKEKSDLTKRGEFKFDLIPAKDIMGKQVFYKRDFEWKGEDAEYFSLNGKEPIISEKWYLKKIKGQQEAVQIPMKVWLKFLGIYIAEGCVVYPKKGSRIIISTNNKDKRQAEIIESVRELCKYLKRSCTIDRYGRAEFGDLRLALYLEKLGKAHHKYIPREYFRLNKELLNILLNGLVMGDVTRLKTKCNSYRYYTVSKQLADDVQELALKCGYASVINYGNGRESVIKGKRIIKSRPAYSIGICSSLKIPEIYSLKRQGIIEKFSDYNGYVYCVEVPNSIVYVRRNGKSVWCGNCSMGDLLGTGVPYDWTMEVLGIMAKTPQHIYYVLTKNPGRYKDFIPFWPRNAWAGVTIDDNKNWKRNTELSRFKNSMQEERNIDITTFISIEPMLSAMPDLSIINRDWVIIGGMSKRTPEPFIIPEQSWIDPIVAEARANKIPVFLKNNLPGAHLKEHPLMTKTSVRL
jgi:protein gp37